jgi:molybdopterin converting factor small subunit
MNVEIPSPLHSYTKSRAVVEAAGSTLSEVFDDLERQFPGIRFRMVDEQERVRPHILVYVDGESRRTLEGPAGRVIRIVAALSGG